MEKVGWERDCHHARDAGAPGWSTPLITPHFRCAPGGSCAGFQNIPPTAEPSGPRSSMTGVGRRPGGVEPSPQSVFYSVFLFAFTTRLKPRQLDRGADSGFFSLGMSCRVLYSSGRLILLKPVDHLALVTNCFPIGWLSGAAGQQKQ